MLRAARVVKTMLTADEIAEERCVVHLGIRVKSREGYLDVTHVCKTVPLPVCELKTTKRSLVCSAKHLVALGDDSGEFCPVERLAPGNTVISEDGIEMVESVTDLHETRELYDLRVEGPDHVYFTNGLLSHNSTGIGGGLLYKLNMIDHYRALYIAPLKDQVKTFADRLQDMQRGSIFSPDAIVAKGLRNNLYYKESPRGGSLRLQNLLTDPSRVRGQSVDEIVIDECQDFDMDHLQELTQVQKASKRPSRVFAGTSKEIDTCLEVHYQKGSRGVWHVRGGKPGRWWSLNDPDVIDKIITVDGLRCPETKKLLNPMDGEFVHEDPRRIYAGFPSFHLPQIIVPEYASGVKWLEIWEDFKHYPRPKFLKEVMGIPVESGSREITENDLKQMCDPDMTFGKIQAEILSGKRRYHYIISGCDWGGSDYNPASKTKQSYTVHVMLGITHDGNFDLIHAARYAGMAYQDIAGQIVHNHNKFNGFAIATDNGVGHYYNAYLRDCGKIRSDRLILFQYNDVKDYMAQIENAMFNLYSLNRTDSLSALFADVKAPRMRLRCPRWDESSPFLLDFLNSIRTITELPNGRGIMRYVRHGSKADDFMQAVNFAVNLGRVLLRENMIPSQQLLDEMAHTMQSGASGYSGNSLFQGGWGEYFSG